MPTFRLVLLLAVLTLVTANNTRTRSLSNKRREKTPFNLCSKDFDSKLACHCSHDDTKRTVVDVDCFVLHQEFPQTDSTWLAFRQHPNLRHFSLTVHRNGYMNYLPIDVLKIQRDLRTININYADIREIPSHAFGNLTRLENITLLHSQIESIDAQAFDNLVALKSLNLDGNLNLELDPAAFTNLPELQELSLAKNNISVLHEDMFAELNKLVRLELNENLIVDLSREMFRGLTALRRLNLAMNSIKHVQGMVFSELWSLHELDLDYNGIERLSERAFDGLTSLRSLNLKSNRLKSLPGGLFTGVPALTTLNLNNNHLETLSESTVQPLMENLVNNTYSVLLVSDNKFVCDCRLSWVFELRNRTRNTDLRRTIEKVTCQPMHLDNHDLETNTLGTGVHHHSQHQHQQHDISQEFDDLANGLYAGGLSQPPKVHHHRRDHHQHKSGHSQQIDLIQMGVENLPCPEELIDSTELPMSRESKGMDLSWLPGNGATASRSIGWVTLITIFSALAILT